MLHLILLVFATAFLAYANGANDNFKGVATIYGSGTASFRSALAWATAATFVGAAASIFVAELLVDRFSGKGLVPDALTQSPEFLLAVALGAGLTVIAASWIGLPISTTHSLTGALVGGGLVAAGSELNLVVLGGAFVLPLIASPFMAAALSNIGYFGVRRLGLSPEPVGHDAESETEGGDESLGSKYAAAGLSLRGGLDRGHLASAGAVSFARGLNDTPKIVALILVVDGLDLTYGMIIVALAMAVGGLLHARKVAEVMSKQITPISRRQGLVANMVTGLLVVLASRFGLPVSTTHVSVGSIFGIGAATRRANLGMVRNIVLSWVLTLPIAAMLSAVSYAIFTF